MVAICSRVGPASRCSSMYSTTARSRPRGSVPSRLRAELRGARTWRIRCTARRLASDSEASGPPTPPAVVGAGPVGLGAALFLAPEAGQEVTAAQARADDLERRR